jgi:hypothetical protein
MERNINVEQSKNNTDSGKTKYAQTWPSATLPTINLTWPVLESTPGLHGDKPATNRERHYTEPELFSLLNINVAKINFVWHCVIYISWLKYEAVKDALDSQWKNK